jgi:predicted esterase
VKKTTVQTEYQMEYDLTLCDKASRNYLILHGFYESAPIIKKKLFSLIPKNSNILIPNGCFPLPKRRPDGWELFFSWYFFDEKTQAFYIEYSFPAGVLEKLYNQLLPNDLPLTIIGYSQGGYLSPFVAEKIKACDQVLTLGCSYRHELLNGSKHFKINAIHGAIDDKVDPINAKKCFDQLPSELKGTFEMLEDVGHELEIKFLDRISSNLK